MKKITLLKTTLLVMSFYAYNNVSAQTLEFRLQLDGNITDTSGNNRAFSDYTIVGGEVANYVTDGTRGTVRDFDGLNSYAAIISDDWFGIAGNAARSTALWMKTTGSTKLCLVGWGDKSGAGTRWELFCEANTNTARQEVESGFTRVDPNVTINDGSWHHIVVTFDPTDDHNGIAGTTGNTRFYIDGVLQTNSAHATTVDTVLDKLQLGVTGNDAGKFIGQLSDVRVYSGVLDATQITTIMSGGTLSIKESGFSKSELSLSSTVISDFLNIKSSLNDELNVQVFNLLGEPVRVLKSNEAEVKVDMQSLSSGLYIIKVSSNSITGSYKVIKK